MKQILTTFVFFISLCALQAQSKIIKGKVTQMDSPLVNVKISVSGSETATTTDANGFYQITAEPRDMLIYTYPGLNDVQILVEDVTRILNIEMSQEIHQLDEVTVKGSNRKSQNELQQEYSYNPNLIKTAYGILDSETAPGKIRFLQENQINDVGICILDLMKNEFPGVNVVGDCVYGGLIYIRGLNSVSQAPPAVYDVDGQVLTQTPTWIAPAAIKRLAVLNNLAMTTRYGSIGAGGVIVINTKSGSSSSKAKDGKPFDQAKLTNNKYDNSAQTAGDIKQNNPVYLTKLLDSKTEAEAKSLYQEQIKMYCGSYYYVLDAYDYFSNRWKNQVFADEILSANRNLFNTNPLALKSLAYIYQAEGRLEKANEVYKEIFTLRSNYAQSYMDLANSYREIGEYQKSAAIYARYGYLIEEGFLKNEGDLGLVLDREFNNLLTLKGNDLFSKSKIKTSNEKDEFNGTRLVFEWNDGEAEFELQFVNPEGRYYKSKHSISANPERIKNEKIAGLTNEEFLIDDSIRGSWQVNAKYLGNKSLTPTYLKATIYYNYGNASQRKETKVFKLSLRNVNQQLFKVSNAVSVVSN